LVTWFDNRENLLAVCWRKEAIQFAVELHDRVSTYGLDADTHADLPHVVARHMTPSSSATLMP
jgi:hypothetical protein